MKKLSLNYEILKFNLIILFIIFFLTKSVFSNEILFDIEGNNYTDSDVIISLLQDIPDNASKEYSNEIIQILNSSNFFSDVEVKLIDNKFLIIVKEYPNINNIYFQNNERLKNDELESIVSEINFTRFNSISINTFISELKKIYQSFGYNNIKIDYSSKVYEENNTVDLFFNIIEGEITKIKKIIIKSNNSILDQDIRDIINSKTKTILNIFANNNFKPEIVEKDKYVILNYYRQNGYIDVSVETKIEYLKSNRVNIYFIINEGNVYSFSNINIDDSKNILNEKILDKINNEVEIFLNNETVFSTKNSKF